MTRESYNQQIQSLAVMVKSTEHFARRLSNEAELPFDVVMDDMNRCKNED